MEKKALTLREWSNRRFLKMLGYARKYSDAYGSLIIHEEFTTNDGVTYDTSGDIELGKWVHKQAEKVSPDSAKGQLLTEVGMIWNFNDNKVGIHDLCRQYRIDTEINYLLINQLSYQEFKSKIIYLNENNIPLVNNKGELIDFFYLPNKMLQEKYGITKEEVIRNYFNIEDFSKKRTLT